MLELSITREFFTLTEFRSLVYFLHSLRKKLNKFATCSTHKLIYSRYKSRHFTNYIQKIYTKHKHHYSCIYCINYPNSNGMAQWRGDHEKYYKNKLW